MICQNRAPCVCVCACVCVRACVYGYDILNARARVLWSVFSCKVEAALNLAKSGGGALGGKAGKPDALESKRAAEFRTRLKKEKEKMVKDMRAATGDESTFLVLLSLEEAETLRRALISRMEGRKGDDGDETKKAPSGGGRLMTLEGTVLYDASPRLDSTAAITRRPLARQPSLTLRQPTMQRTNTLALVERVDSTTLMDEVRQCFRFFNCNLWYEEKDIIALLRALRDTDRAARRRHFENVCEGRKRRSRQEWAHTTVAVVFSEPDEDKRVRLLKTTIQMQREMLRSHDSIPNAFVALSARGNSSSVVRVADLHTAFVLLPADGGFATHPVEDRTFKEVSQQSSS